MCGIAGIVGQQWDRAAGMDRMLRAGIFVDLHRVVKQGVRASVEEYSLKKMEAFYGFKRQTSLDASRAAMRYIEHHLEISKLPVELPRRIQRVLFPAVLVVRNDTRIPLREIVRSPTPPLPAWRNRCTRIPVHRHDERISGQQRLG